MPQHSLPLLRSDGLALLPPALSAPRHDPKPGLYRPLTLTRAVLWRGVIGVCLAHHTGLSPPQTWAPRGPDFPWPSSCPGSQRP